MATEQLIEVAAASEAMVFEVVVSSRSMVLLLESGKSVMRHPVEMSSCEGILEVIDGQQ